MTPGEFWACIEVRGPDDCWWWVGRDRARSSGWYGSVSIHGKGMASHRVAYAIANGPIPAGFHVCHRCDNPACCNPAHLFAGTRSDNMKDMVAKGRHLQTTAACGWCGEEFRPAGPQTFCSVLCKGRMRGAINKTRAALGVSIEGARIFIEQIPVEERCKLGARRAAAKAARLDGDAGAA